MYQSELATAKRPQPGTPFYKSRDGFTTNPIKSIDPTVMGHLLRGPDGKLHMHFVGEG